MGENKLQNPSPLSFLEDAVHCTETPDTSSCLKSLQKLLDSNPDNEMLRKNVQILEIHCRNRDTREEDEDEDDDQESKSDIVPNPENGNEFFEAVDQFMAFLSEEDLSCFGGELYNCQPFLYFNLAILLYHYGQFSKVEKLVALVLSSPTYFDWSLLAVKVRMLKIDMYIKSKQFFKAMAAIEEYEARRSQSEMELNKSPSPRTSSPNILLGRTSVEEFDTTLKTRLQFCKTSCCLSTRSLKLAKRECKLLFGLLGTTSHTHIGGMNLKAYQEYLRGNMTKAINFIKTIPPNVLKKVLPTLEQSGELITPIVLNNEACCHFYMGRPLWSALLFKKAIMGFDIQMPENFALPIHAISYKKYQLECLYNFGIACLHAKDTDRAFQCLQGCVRYFGSSPRLWLRLAECCVQKHKATNEFDMKWTEDKKNLLEAIKCSRSSSSPKLIFSDKFNGWSSSSSSNKPNAEEDRTQISPTLFYGSTCVATALALMKPEKEQQNGNNVLVLQVPPSNPLIGERSINALKASILCVGAYISLAEENYPLGVKRSRDLLRIPNLSGAHQYLGKQYLSQALLLAGDVERAVTLAEEAEEPAIDLRYCCSPFESQSGLGGPSTDESRGRDDSQSLMSDSIWGSGSSISSSSHSCNYFGTDGVRKPLQVWYPRDEATAKMLSVYNKACILALAGKLDKADEVYRSWLSQTTGITLPPDFLMLAVYLHIQRGNISKAVSLLKEHSPSAVVT